MTWRVNHRRLRRIQQRKADDALENRLVKVSREGPYEEGRVVGDHLAKTLNIPYVGYVSVQHTTRGEMWVRLPPIVQAKYGGSSIRKVDLGLIPQLAPLESASQLFPPSHTTTVYYSQANPKSVTSQFPLRWS